MTIWLGLISYLVTKVLKFIFFKQTSTQLMLTSNIILILVAKFNWPNGRQSCLIKSYCKQTINTLTLSKKMCEYYQAGLGFESTFLFGAGQAFHTRAIKLGHVTQMSCAIEPNKKQPVAINIVEILTRTQLQRANRPADSAKPTWLWRANEYKHTRAVRAQPAHYQLALAPTVSKRRGSLHSIMLSSCCCGVRPHGGVTQIIVLK